jgi:hypothetical protein
MIGKSQFSDLELSDMWRKDESEDSSDVGMIADESHDVYDVKMNNNLMHLLNWLLRTIQRRNTKAASKRRKDAGSAFLQNFNTFLQDCSPSDH